LKRLILTFKLKHDTIALAMITNHKETKTTEGKRAVIPVAIYGTLFIAWLVMQLHK